MSKLFKGKTTLKRKITKKAIYSKYVGLSLELVHISIAKILPIKFLSLTGEVTSRTLVA